MQIKDIMAPLNNCESLEAPIKQVLLLRIRIPTVSALRGVENFTYFSNHKSGVSPNNTIATRNCEGKAPLEIDESRFHFSVFKS